MRPTVSKDDIRWAEVELHNLELYNGSLDGTAGPEHHRHSVVGTALLRPIAVEAGDG
jgi:hypothetical protein